MRKMLWLLIGVVGVVIVFLGGVWLFQRRLIYFPTKDVPAVETRLPGWEDAAFETTDGLTLYGWFTPPPAGAPVVVVFAGNALNRSARAPLGAAFSAQGFGVLLFDYRGYGDNPGRPTSEGMALDARAALGWVRRQAPGHPLAYFGESLGAAVAVELAVTEPPAALVLRSPFTSLEELARFHTPLPVRGLLRDSYPSIDRIGKVAAPIMIIAGDADTVVPVDQSRALFRAAPEPRELVIVTGADHNDPELTDGPEVVEPAARFIRAATAG